MRRYAWLFFNFDFCILTFYVRTSVIGLGDIGNLHADFYKADPLAELVGVCDRDAARAAETAGKRLGVPHFSNAKAHDGRLTA